MFQQAAVLRNNIDQNVAQLFGAMGPDLWSKQTWTEYFKENMVLVCTADILHQCLLNSYVKMDQINLLILDEAHHAKKDHAYARLVIGVLEEIRIDPNIVAGLSEIRTLEKSHRNAQESLV